MRTTPLPLDPVVGLSMQDLVEIGHQTNRDPRMAEARKAFEVKFDVPTDKASTSHYVEACNAYYRIRNEVRREYVKKRLDEKRNQRA